ncbi:MAG: AMP-binding protein [Candidatus Amulumruptor caecigallinarius]|nr:AMP-binding protein [Candidatus Amulumruptor caecigallinarius]MCM1397710.1 AMP-binding protein [Candidatus Amulumruptor caecigallinarius]MCM1454726.1 AMP-binding protein [bacterium]
MDLLRIYEKSMMDHWELPAISDYMTGITVTYGEVARRIELTHMLYRELGIKPGDKVALMGRNSIEWIVTFMATITYGAVIVPVLQEFNPADAQHIVNHSDAVLLVVGRSIAENLDASQMPALKAVLALEDGEVLAEKKSSRGRMARAVAAVSMKFARRFAPGFGPTDVAYAEVSPDSVAEINYTSGTTGFSKGVMLTYANLAGNVTFGIEAHLYSPTARCLCFLPLAHAYGCAFDMLTPLACGACITVLGKTPTPPVLLKALAAVKPTLILCVPLILEKIYRRAILPAISKPSMQRLLKTPLVGTLVRRKIRRKLTDILGGEFAQVIVGGAPLNPEVEAFLLSIGFPVTVGYGMTECGPLISYTPAKHFIGGSCGRTITGMESKIVGEGDPTLVPGEICVQGVNVMKGYYKNSVATAAVLDDDGWLHTGDMGTRTPDGTLFIKGRYKTMILTATGQNIYPEEIEAKLNNLPYVGESLVVEREGRLVALVYPDYEAMDRDGLTLAGIERPMEHVRRQLNELVAPYERIDRIQVHPTEFVKTPKRSIKRFLYS